ncbi:aldose 1-epimerase [Sulfolobus acidocaldarius SUSAZ]|nr:aldose 1-epimerase [Sulfolobus acidocaldarius SUSAZ]
MILKKGRAEAEILNKGAYLYSFKINGKDLVLQGNTDRVTRGGMAVLIPFANRIKGGEYTFDGIKYELPKNKEGNAIHGLVLDKEFSVIHNERDFVILNYLLEDKGYPTKLNCLVLYKLFENGFMNKIVVQNVGDKRAPLTVGTHPYFVVSSDWEIITRGEVRKLESIDNIPTGEIKQVKLSHGEYDDCFIIRGDIILKSTHSKLKITRRKNLNYIQIYTGVKGAVAIEPMSGAPDAIHNKMGIKVIKPGQKHEFSYEVRFYL